MVYFRVGDIVRHFKYEFNTVEEKEAKRYLYRIDAIGLDVTTGVEAVAYTALYAPYATYIRTLHEFSSVVDKAKYPQVQQAYRFEVVNSVEHAEQHSKIAKIDVVFENLDHTTFDADVIQCMSLKDVDYKGDFSNVQQTELYLHLDRKANGLHNPFGLTDYKTRACEDVFTRLCATPNITNVYVTYDTPMQTQIDYTMPWCGTDEVNQFQITEIKADGSLVLKIKVNTATNANEVS